MLLDCTHCDGFIPPQQESCPHCGGTSTARRVGGKAVKAAGVAATMMTLMACYGAGYDSYPQEEGGPTLSVRNACETATVIDSSGIASGSLDGGSNALEGSCMGAQQGNERVHRYSNSDFAGVLGTLTISWTSSSPVGVYVLNRCNLGTGNDNEISCATPSVDSSIVLQNFTSQDIDIVVDSTSTSPSADYELKVVFTPGECGNGVLEALETCDDGNRVDGDGCSSSCADENVEACELAQELQLGANVGDTSTLASDSNGPSCIGPDKIYQYTASSAGTLTVALDAATNMSLKLMDECNVTSLATACTDEQPAGIPEVGSVYLLDGESVFVLVDAVDVADGGSYELDAAFMPNQ